MSAGAWVERGTGILRLNLTRDSDSDKSGARLGKSPLSSVFRRRD